MADSQQTDRWTVRPDAEAIFAAFVRNANAVGAAPKTVRAQRQIKQPIEATGEVEQPPVENTGPVVLLTKKKSDMPPAPAAPSDNVVRLPPGPNTQKMEAARVVPDVKSVQPPAPPVPEKAEDGQIPSGELDRMLADMGVLLRYGHEGEVQRRLDELTRRYPEDLLLLRRIAEFHLEHQRQEPAMETLFVLAGRLFERRNVEGMRSALSQVLVLDPTNKRAFRLLGLLEQRPDTGTGR